MLAMRDPNQRQPSSRSSVERMSGQKDELPNAATVVMEITKLGSVGDTLRKYAALRAGRVQ